MVTLKIPTENLKTIKAKSEISKRPPQKKAMNSVFSSMMQQSQSNAPRLTPLQKLKELYPLPLARDEFHVVPVKENYINIKNYNFGLLPKVKMPSNNSANTQSEYVDDSLGRETTIYQKRYTYTPKSQSIYELVHKRLPGLENIPHLNRIYNNFIVKKQEANESALWTDYFKPTKTSDLLIPYEGKKHIKNWISNSFGRLKAQSLAIPRNVQLKKKKKKMNDSLYDDFIVPDDEDGEATEEEIFVPVLIIHGATGVGKSASVYAALHEINGYVHEINSGQARGRRDLHSTLKELSTTQLVHNVDSEDGKKGEFQRGIILFDDTDVLFEQDRTFWTVVQEIINISRRPIVITCKDMSNIPNTIIDNAKEDNAIIKIDNEINEVTRTELRNYLWLCSLSCGYDVEDEVINEIIDNCATKLNQSPHFDLRESFMELQMACYSQLKHDGAISVLKDDIQVDINSFDGSDDLEEFADKFDILSIADVISSNTISMIKAHPQENEFVDINILEESNLLRQRTLPFELNIGDLLVDKKITTDVITKHTFNKIRQYVTDFTGSRSKKLPKYLLDSPQIARRSTRSFNSSYDENSGSTTPIPDFYSRERVGIPDGSICYYLNETAYKTELAPMSRNWARFQRSLDEKEIEVYRDHNISIKQFMGWRQFQSDSTDLLSTFFY